MKRAMMAFLAMATCLTPVTARATTQTKCYVNLPGYGHLATIFSGTWASPNPYFGPARKIFVQAEFDVQVTAPLNALSVAVDPVTHTAQYIVQSVRDRAFQVRAAICPDCPVSCTTFNDNP